MTRRDWRLAREKINAERKCRVCESRSVLEAAHTFARSYDAPGEVPGLLVVAADDVVPLCRDCHRAYDARELDLLPFLTLAEQAAVVAHVGILRALNRVCSLRRNAPPKHPEIG